MPFSAQLNVMVTAASKAGRALARDFELRELPGGRVPSLEPDLRGRIAEEQV